jgi:hypothetical protein
MNFIFSFGEIEREVRTNSFLTKLLFNGLAKAIIATCAFPIVCNRLTIYHSYIIVLVDVPRPIKPNTVIFINICYG